MEEKKKNTKENKKMVVQENETLARKGSSAPKTTHNVKIIMPTGVAYRNPHTLEAHNKAAYERDVARRAALTKMRNNHTARVIRGEVIIVPSGKLPGVSGKMTGTKMKVSASDEKAIADLMRAGIIDESRNLKKEYK